VVEEIKRVERREKSIEIVDLRSKAEGWQVEGAQIFVEGKSAVAGLNRYQLKKADELVLYTSPPGQRELRSMLETVKPKKIYLIGVNPPEFTPQGFLTHLAGLVKYTIAKKDGKTEISTLAAVTAQREATIRLGLEWLAAGGQVVVNVEGDEALLRRHDEGGMMKAEYAQSDLFLAVKGLLAETVAFRKHFLMAEGEKLLVLKDSVFRP